MTLTLSDGRKIRYCVMIPSRGRGDIIRTRFRAMPYLNDPDVWVGVQTDERDAYAGFEADNLLVRTVPITNAMGSVSLARQQIKDAVHASGRRYTHYVTMDDNTFVEQSDLENLVRCCAEWPEPCAMAGLHRVALHFDRARIAKGTTTIHGLRSYESVSMMLVCVPRVMWVPYTYPADAYGLDDRHWYLWLLSKGFTNFRVCLDAKFRKPRYQRGGQGDLDARARKCGLAIARLAADFPEMVGSNGTLRIPWDFILARKRGATSHRLAMGSTLRTGDMTSTPAAPRRIPKHKKETV